MTNIEILQELISKNGNCVNLGRTIKANHISLYDWVVDQTSFLISPKFNERIFCIINNSSSVPINDDGTFCNFINLFQGYRKPKISVIKPEKKCRTRQLPKTPMEEYLIRNKKRSANLYHTGMVEYIDYVICPHTNTRKTMIESKYITAVLEMTVEQYDSLYPGIQKIATSRMDKIKSGLQQIDIASGLSKHKLSTIKAIESLERIGDDGLNGYDRKGKKTRQTHMNNVDEFGRNGYRRQADNRLTTILSNGLTVEENAHIKQRETLITNNIAGNGGASKISKKKLKPILDFLEENNIAFYFDKAEYGIKDTDTQNYYFYDLTILKYNITIEYQSNAWHSNPTWDDTKWDAWCPPRGKKKTALESLDYDYNKARSLYKFRNIVTYYVWEDTAENDVKDMICLLQIMNTKY